MNSYTHDPISMSTSSREMIKGKEVISFTTFTRDNEEVIASCRFDFWENGLGDVFYDFVVLCYPGDCDKEVVDFDADYAVKAKLQHYGRGVERYGHRYNCQLCDEEVQVEDEKYTLYFDGYKLCEVCMKQREQACPSL